MQKYRPLIASAMLVMLSALCAGAQTPQPTATPAAEETAGAEGSTHELAKQLQNPVASLISVPLQNNYDCGFGPRQACRNTLNIQPVVPFSLNEKYNLIVRTILPVIWQDKLTDTDDTDFGLGDITQSFFFSPKKKVGGLILAAGPALLYPTATSREFGPGKWAAGPTLLGLKQSEGWTYGALTNHLWSFAGPKSRGDLSATFLQPFVSHTWKNAWTASLNTESTYDWEGGQWTVPVNASVSKVTSFGRQPMSVGFGAKYYAERPEGGPRWGYRFVVTLLYPQKR